MQIVGGALWVNELKVSYWFYPSEKYSLDDSIPNKEVILLN